MLVPNCVLDGWVGGTQKKKHPQHLKAVEEIAIMVTFYHPVSLSFWVLPVLLFSAMEK